MMDGDIRQNTYDDGSADALTGEQRIRRQRLRAFCGRLYEVDVWNLVSNCNRHGQFLSNGVCRLYQRPSSLQYDIRNEAV